MPLNKMASMFPYFTQGTVVRGFGRGSKQLGIPTANYPDLVVDGLPLEFHQGVYYGWASVDCGPIHKMVMSIGFNPFYKNKKRTMETHIMHTFQNDFYGSLLKVCMCGFIRSEKDFNSVDELIAAINADIKEADIKLELPENKMHRDNKLFKMDSSL